MQKELFDYVAERACQFELARTLHGGALDAKHFAADLGEGESVDRADLVLVVNNVRNDPVKTEVFFDIALAYDASLFFSFDDKGRSLAADRTDLAFEITDA